MKAVNIVWDVDEEIYGNMIDELALPSEVEVPDEVMKDDVADYLAENYGFCVFEFSLS